MLLTARRSLFVLALSLSALSPLGCDSGQGLAPPDESEDEIRRRHRDLATPHDLAAPADLAAHDLGRFDLGATAVRLRIMSGNLSSGTKQSYDPGEGMRIFEGVKPDVALIQEFNFGSNSAADIRRFVDTAFGPGYAVAREGNNAQIPNGIISRYPIVQSGEWTDSSVSNRDFVWARIDVPGPIDLWAVSVHLLTSSAAARATEAQQLVGLIKQQVPAGDYLVIGGDFNTSTRSETALTTFAQVVTTAGPYPADRNGNDNTNAARAKPYDWVLADHALDLLRAPVVIGASSFASGLVADTRVYSPLSEVTPALAGDSGATNMQHMGVVRDFLLPASP